MSPALQEDSLPTELSERWSQKGKLGNKLNAHKRNKGLVKLVKGMIACSRERILFPVRSIAFQGKYFHMAYFSVKKDGGGVGLEGSQTQA